MALLLFSRRCKHSINVINFIQKNKPLHTLIQLHDVNQAGVPQQLHGKITGVPTLITQNGQIMEGREVKNWLESMIPNREPEYDNSLWGGLGAGMQSLDSGDSDGSFYDLDSYGSSLAPKMTPELEKKINSSVSEAYSAAQQDK